MDPNATYDALVEAYLNDDWELATECARNLWNWLAIGGFKPDRPPLHRALTHAYPGDAPGLAHLARGINRKLAE